MHHYNYSGMLIITLECIIIITLTAKRSDKLDLSNYTSAVDGNTTGGGLLSKATCSPFIG